MTPTTELLEAAKAVIARWDSTDWKAAPTAEVMNRLRNALAEVSRREEVEMTPRQGALLVESLCKIITASGVVADHVETLSGPQLLMLADDVVEILSRREAAVMIPPHCDCPRCQRTQQPEEVKPAKCVCYLEGRTDAPICDTPDPCSLNHCKTDGPYGIRCGHRKACHGGAK
jgi:hypothetical protein